MPPRSPSPFAARPDDEGNFGGVDQLLQEVTFTGEWKFAEGFLARLELRRDWSDTRYFTGAGGADDLRDHQNTISLGLVWWMGNKKGVW